MNNQDKIALESLFGLKYDELRNEAENGYLYGRRIGDMSRDDLLVAIGFMARHPECYTPLEKMLG